MCGRTCRDTWVMGTLPPLVSMKVTGGEISTPARVGGLIPGKGRLVALRPVVFRLAGGGFLKSVQPVVEGGRAVSVYETLHWATRPVRVGLLHIMVPHREKEGETEVMQWTLTAGPGGVFATQGDLRKPREERGDWSHFYDSLEGDQSAYVHAAVARVGAVLIGAPVPEPALHPEAQCLTCQAFRRVPGPDPDWGDVDSRVPSLSTWALREQGPWVEEAYWCVARQAIPEDVRTLVREWNKRVIHGDPQPVLPLERAGEDCRLYLPKGTGRRGGIPAWEIPAGYAAEPVVRQEDGVRTLFVRGGQWQVELAIKHAGQDLRPVESDPCLPETIVVKHPATGEEHTWKLARRGQPQKGVLSYNSPLVSAALAVQPGQEFEVAAPGGAYRLVRLA